MTKRERQHALDELGKRLSIAPDDDPVDYRHVGDALGSDSDGEVGPAGTLDEEEQLQRRVGAGLFDQEDTDESDPDDSAAPHPSPPPRVRNKRSRQRVAAARETAEEFDSDELDSFIVDDEGGSPSSEDEDALEVGSESASDNVSPDEVMDSPQTPPSSRRESLQRKADARKQLVQELAKRKRKQADRRQSRGSTQSPGSTRRVSRNTANVISSDNDSDSSTEQASKRRRKRLFKASELARTPSKSQSSQPSAGEAEAPSIEPRRARPKVAISDSD